MKHLTFLALIALFVVGCKANQVVRIFKVTVGEKQYECRGYRAYEQAMLKLLKCQSNGKNFDVVFVKSDVAEITSDLVEITSFERNRRSYE